MNQKLTVIILSHQIVSQKILDSIHFADEVIILHDSSSGNKPPLITNPKIKIYSRPLQNFASQRNFALTKSTNNWVMFLDSDEIISPQLAIEIKKVLEKPNFSGYYFHRFDQYYNQILHHGEIGQTEILRLALKNSGQWQRSVHETWKVKGKTGLLKNPLLHHHPDLVNRFFTRFLIYCPFDALSLTKEGKPFSYFRLLTYPLAKFIQNYIFRLGFFDGHLGLFHAYIMSLQSLTVRIYQKNKQKST